MATEISATRIAIFTAIAAVAFAGIFLALDQFVVREFDPLQKNAPHSVVIYTTEQCGSCIPVRACLKENAVPFVEKDIGKSLTARAEHWALRARGVPVMMAGNEVVYGFRKDEIRTILAEAGYAVHCWPSLYPGRQLSDMEPPHQ